MADPVYLVRLFAVLSVAAVLGLFAAVNGAAAAGSSPTHHMHRIAR